MLFGGKQKALHGLAAEARAIVRFEPVEGAIRLWIQPELGAVLNEGTATLRIFHRAARFHLIRPGFDFERRFRGAVGLQPGADILIIGRGLNSGFELLAGDALEVEEHIVQRTIVMIFAQRPRQAGATFVNGTADDRESGQALARAVRGLFGQVSGDNGGIHNFNHARALVWVVKLG